MKTKIKANDSNSFSPKRHRRGSASPESSERSSSPVRKHRDHRRNRSRKTESEEKDRAKRDRRRRSRSSSDEALRKRSKKPSRLSSSSEGQRRRRSHKHDRKSDRDRKKKDKGKHKRDSREEKRIKPRTKARDSFDSSDKDKHSRVNDKRRENEIREKQERLARARLLKFDDEYADLLQEKLGKLQPVNEVEMTPEQLRRLDLSKKLGVNLHVLDKVMNELESKAKDAGLDAVEEDYYNKPRDGPVSGENRRAAVDDLVDELEKDSVNKSLRSRRTTKRITNDSDSELDPLDEFMQTIQTQAQTSGFIFGEGIDSKPIWAEPKEPATIKKHEHHPDLTAVNRNQSIPNSNGTETQLTAETPNQLQSESIAYELKGLTSNSATQNPVHATSDHQPSNLIIDRHDENWNGGANKLMEVEENEEEDDNFLAELKRRLAIGNINHPLAESNGQSDNNDNRDVPQIMDGENVENGDKLLDNVSEHSGVLENEKQPDYFDQAKKIQKKKAIEPIDFMSKIYNPIRKNLYIESKEIAEMTEEQVEELRARLGEIKIRGTKSIRPIFNWNHCGLSKRLLNLLTDKLNFSHPFPIQCQSIPIIMSGRDMIGIAETGSGKTLAYVLPMIRHINDQEPLKPGEGPIALIMVPTRELAGQVYSTVKLFGKAMNIRVAAVYGGRSIGTQIADIKAGAEVLVCTPGRMIEVLSASSNRSINLDRTTFVVIDEADRMFDFGFEPQLTKILSIVRPTRQTVMFSATFPKNVETLARRVLDKPLEIVVGTRGQICKAVDQSIIVIEEDQKLLKTLELLGIWLDQGSVIIFVEKQCQADELFAQLAKYRYMASVLHGGQDQQDRENTIEEFRKGTSKILLATSLAARGLDINNISLVINYQCPTYKEEYIHRIGRTGRAGRKGHAVTFITKEEDKYAGDLIQALQISGAPVSEDLVALHREFKKKVQRGEVREFKNKNLAGSGYKFDSEEAAKIRQVQKLLSQAYGLNIEELDDNEADEEFKRLQQSKKIEKEHLKLIKDPRTLEEIKRSAIKAATDSIKQGMNSEQILLAAQHAIKDFLFQYNPELRSKNQSSDLKVNSEALVHDKIADKISAELDINDYPESARKRVSAKDYLDQVGELTTTQISVRGVWTKPGVRNMYGQKRLHIHIEGDTKFSVQSALYEIKRYCEESAMNSF
jgi:ATP-dependent RNA helicase DDX46/PRP5